MADTVRKVTYAYVTVPNRPGQGAKVLGSLKDAGVNLVAYSGFPVKGGKAQLDLVAAGMAPIRRAAAKNGWRLSKVKRAFLIQGKDEVGALHRHIRKLAAGKVSVTAADALSAGKGRYAMIIWVKARDHTRAARLLGAK